MAESENTTSAMNMVTFFTKAIVTALDNIRYINSRYFYHNNIVLGTNIRFYLTYAYNRHYAN